VTQHRIVGRQGLPALCRSAQGVGALAQLGQRLAAVLQGLPRLGHRGQRVCPDGGGLLFPGLGQPRE
jgi:hypothetical protein